MLCSQKSRPCYSDFAWFDFNAENLIMITINDNLDLLPTTMNTNQVYIPPFSHCFSRSMCVYCRMRSTLVICEITSAVCRTPNCSIPVRISVCDIARPTLPENIVSGDKTSFFVSSSNDGIRTSVLDHNSFKYVVYLLMNIILMKIINN